MLTPIGPGVDSLIATMVVKSVRLNHPYFNDISCKKGIVASPPPMENNPVLKNSQHNNKKFAMMNTSLVSYHDKFCYKTLFCRIFRASFNAPDKVNHVA